MCLCSYRTGASGSEGRPQQGHGHAVGGDIYIWGCGLLHNTSLRIRAQSQTTIKGHLGCRGAPYPYQWWLIGLRVALLPHTCASPHVSMSCCLLLVSALITLLTSSLLNAMVKEGDNEGLSIPDPLLRGSRKTYSLLLLCHPHPPPPSWLRHLMEEEVKHKIKRRDSRRGLR